MTVESPLETWRKRVDRIMAMSISQLSRLALEPIKSSKEALDKSFFHSVTTTSASSQLSYTAARKWALLPLVSTNQAPPNLNRSHPVSTPEVDKLLNAIKWDKNGLAVAIAQHLDTGAILMQGFANSDAVSATIASGKATFYSRSRSSLWTKGETSSNFINVMDIFLDCDRDSIIYLGLPDGPTCHTGAETCYFTPASTVIGTEGAASQFALTTLFSLEETIIKRKAQLNAQCKPSWTHKLLKDHGLLCSKIREEADELCRTLEDNEGKDRMASEMADVLYHSMVLLAVQDVKLEDVLEVLRKRFTQSGIEEKNRRK